MPRIPTRLLTIAALAFLASTWRLSPWVGMLQAADPFVTHGATFDPYHQPAVEVPVAESPWGIDILPDGLIYRPYLAGPKESRTGVQFAWNDRDGCQT